ncbi:MAG: hypothetical protein WAQ24_03235 [Candidatus Saccharimonadales bacterium]
MLTLLISILVPLIVYIVTPRLLKTGRKQQGWLIAACSLFFISYFLPSPLVHGTETQFMTHLVGGGFFSGFLWLYIVRAKRIVFQNALVEVASLFALVCTLGVMNELFEIVIFWLGRMPMGIADTSWDLVANTIGALSFYLAYVIARNFECDE